MSSDFYTYSMGATQLIIGLSLTLEVSDEQRHHKTIFKKFSGGSLAIVDGASMVASSGYMMGNNEVISLYGPVRFYLAAAGATTIVHMAKGYTDGRS